MTARAGLTGSRRRRQEQREQLLRAWRRRRLPVRPARAVIGPYGVMWKEIL